jgi:ABC-type nitrate/sulfonate/bicarbonate transport system substrate-binding protein
MTKKLISIRIAGVPEHFNLPWHLAIEKKKFQKKGINLIWKDYHGGTGAMCEALRNNKVDIALVLTEGAFKELSSKNHSKIVKIYVDSPLLWGIHVGMKSKLNKNSNLKDATVAISRFGSGSHLMAKVNAHNNKWNVDTLTYKTVNNIEGGIKEISNNDNSYFLWEHFTTKPFVESGNAKEINTIKTPWPCFVILVKKETIKNNKKELKKIIKIINKQIKKIEKKKLKKETISLFANKYQQKEKDIKEWLSITKWNSKKGISKKEFKKIQKKLMKYKVNEKPFKYKDIIENLF